MRTKLWTSLLVALTMIIGSFASAQSSKLPTDARFDRPLKIDVRQAGIPLGEYLKLIGTAVGLNVVTQGVDDKAVVNYDFSGKPFRQVWELVVSLNGLDYEMQPNDVIIVGPPSVINLIRKPAAVAATGPGIQRIAYEIQGDPNVMADLIKKEFEGVVVSVIPNSKSLIVSANAEQHTQIRDLLKQVDRPATVLAGVNVVRRVYPLSNTDAVKLAKALQESTDGVVQTDTGATQTTLPGQTGTAATPAAATAASGQQSSKIKIVAEEGSNSLIITGPAEQVKDILDMLPSLDRSQSLVNVNIRMQEITDSAGRDLGIDWSGGIGNFSMNILNGTIRALFDATKSLAGLNIGAALTALETQKLTRRIDDTTLTVLNNGQAKLKRGGRIELNIPGGGGQSISKTLEYGVLITAKPQVSPDGTIRLTLNADVSNLVDPTNININRIDFENRSEETTVSLRPGQSLLLGSLLQTSSSNITQGVPVLSAIPLVGELFKKRSTSANQLQLLVILSANIVK